MNTDKPHKPRNKVSSLLNLFEDGPGSAAPGENDPEITDAWVEFTVVMTTEDYDAFEDALMSVDEVQPLTGNDAVKRGEVVAALAAEYLAGLDHQTP
jgi:hypothetical protein